MPPLADDASQIEAATNAKMLVAKAKQDALDAAAAGGQSGQSANGPFGPTAKPGQLSIDRSTGQISGKAPQTGSYDARKKPNPPSMKAR